MTPEEQAWTLVALHGVVPFVSALACSKCGSRSCHSLRYGHGHDLALVRCDECSHIAQCGWVLRAPPSLEWFRCESLQMAKL